MKRNISNIFCLLLVFSLLTFSSEALSATKKKKVAPAPKKPTTQNYSNKLEKAKPLKPDINESQNRPAPKPVTNSSGKLMSASLVTKNPSIKARTITVTQEKSFLNILSDLGFNQRQISSLSSRMAREGGFVVTSARIGQQVIVAEKVENGKRKILALQIPTDKYILTIAKNSLGSVEIVRTARKDVPAESKARFFYKSGQVQTTIQALGASLGVPTSVTDKAVRVLNGKVNVSQVKRGDRVEMLYENSYNAQGQKIGIRLLYVSLVSQGVRTEGFRYGADGKDSGEFFDANGNSFTKSMLASPLKGKHKISSPFGYRLHPILGRRLLHSGVDFKAKMGEAVYAAGDGTIDKFGREGGYGNFIRVKHDSTWSTAYGHLSAFARGQSLWKRVKKGELIGYVGSTGRSTGPHLHFELQQLGTAIDPLKAKLPMGGKKLIARDLYNFRQEMHRLRDLISQNKS